MREGWTYKKLGEVANIKSGYTPSSSDLSDSGVIPYFKVGDMNNVGNEKYLHYTSSFVNETFKTFPQNSIVFPKNGAAIATNKKRILKQSSVVDLNTAVLIPTQTENIEFLYYWISNIDFRDITRRGTIPTLDTKTLMLLEIPVPPLSEQQRIVSELDLLSSIIEKKKAQLKEYDALAQSIFYDMFGDPVTNEKGWEVKKLGEVCKKITDGTHDTPQRLEKGVKFITGKHIRPFLVDYDNSDYVTEEVHKEIFQRCNPELGDVLYTNIGAGIGNAAINSVEYEFSMKNVALLKPLRSNVNGYYLEFYLNNDKIKTIIIDNYSNGGAQKFLSLKSIAKIPVSIPPLSLQQSFASKIEAIERQKALIQQSITEAETLFNSRMDYWFS